MGNRNGYFQLLVEEAKTSLKMYPPEGEGEPFPLGDLFNYLERLKIPYDMVETKSVYDSIEDGPVMMPLRRAYHYQEREIMILTVSEDKMSVTVRFMAPSNKGEKMDMVEILGDLLHKGIKAGVKKEVIESFLNNREYCKDYVVAEGKPPTRGEDARIEYYFNTDLSMKPAENEDGSVDFRNLNNICPVQEGELLARLYKEKPGTPGFNVFGEKIRPADVKRLRLQHGGNNVSRNEDKTELYSMVNGHVSLVGNQVFVSNVYDVEDVGNATGNIDYDGTVNIKGNVNTGFKVYAKGNIVVGGVVEGAELEAEGEIILKRGIQGGGRAQVKAKGNIVAKFIEGATVSAEGYIRTESILLSNVSAKGEVEVSGRKGFVTGGTVRSLSMITVKTIGSETGGSTRLEVGVDPVLKEQFNVLEREITDIEEQMTKLYPVLVAFGKRIGKGEKLEPDKIAQMRALTKTYSEMEADVKKKRKEYEEIRECLKTDANACIKVTGMIYPGANISISDVSMKIKSRDQYCRFIKEDGEVHRKPL